MKKVKPQNQSFEIRGRQGYLAQPMMKALGVKIEKIEAGEVWLSMPFHKRFTQHHGYLHAGAYTSMMDSASGFAAFTLMAEDEEVVTTDFKNSFLRPATGERFLAKARVIKPGKTLYFTQCDCFALEGEKEKIIAQMTATMMAVKYEGSAADQ
ncbi:MAG: PaaI family thioesterase [Pseudomonadota bacterium]